MLKSLLSALSHTIILLPLNVYHLTEECVVLGLRCAGSVLRMLRTICLLSFWVFHSIHSTHTIWFSLEFEGMWQFEGTHACMHVRCVCFDAYATLLCAHTFFSVPNFYFRF